MALGGMRNPHLAVQRMPHMGHRPETLGGSPGCFTCTGIGHDILTGRMAAPFPAEVVDRLRARVAEALGTKLRPRHRTARASTPLNAGIIEAWGVATRDPDTKHLSQWLDHGAPLGYSESIPPAGIFPEVPRAETGQVAQQDLEPSKDGRTTSRQRRKQTTSMHWLRTTSTGSSAMW